MPAKTWTEDDVNYLKDNYINKNSEELAKDLGKTVSSIRSKRRNLKLQLPQQKRIERREDGRKKACKVFMLTPEEEAYVIENYLTTPIKTIGHQINRSYTGIMGCLKRLGLTIPEEIREERRKMGMFRKGKSPPNKGQKMSDEVKEKVKHTMFKKGRKPHNTKTDGHITWRVGNNHSPGYYYIRVGLGEWMPYHRYLWEQEYGKIQEDLILVFKNQNTKDVRLDNLELITKGENARRNVDYTRSIEMKLNLEDNYVAGILKRGLDIKTKDIPKELIELKRNELLIKRELKKQLEDGK